MEFGTKSSSIDGENVKIIEWEELEEELARLWSFSSELKKSKEKKELLAQKLQILIEARAKSLRLSNEIDDMREQLEDRKESVKNLSVNTSNRSYDISNRKEQLCQAIRLLLIAAEALSIASKQVQEADKLLCGERGHQHLKDLQRVVRTRQQYLIRQVSMLYNVRESPDQTSWKTTVSSDSIESISGKEAQSSSAPKSINVVASSLTVLGLQVAAPPLKKMSFFSDKKEVQRSASALGYVAHAVSLISSYLDVQLRYPLRLRCSRSSILDYAPSIESTSDSVLNPIINTHSKPMEFPLYLEGQDTTRAAYGMFLLNKDLEQILNYIGVNSLGPRHVLANLRELYKIILSPDYLEIDSISPVVES